jgi:hypothetical protein
MKYTIGIIAVAFVFASSAAFSADSDHTHRDGAVYQTASDCSDMKRPILVPDQYGVRTPLYTNDSRWCQSSLGDDSTFRSEGVESGDSASASE